MSDIGDTNNQYGKAGGPGRTGFVVCEVVGDPKDDPEQSGRLQCRMVGYEDTIPDGELPWSRVGGGSNNPMLGGQGKTTVGPLKGSFMMGHLSEGGQQPILTGAMPSKAGKGDGDQLDTSGRNHDFPRMARDKGKFGGGDDSVDPKTLAYRGMPILDYAKDKAPNPEGRTESKFGSLDAEQDYSIGYALT